MVLIFNGVISPRKTGSGTGYDAIWDGWYCAPQLDSIQLVSDPQRGTVAMFTTRPGLGYDCGGGQHNQLSAYTGKAIPRTYREVWYGWSHKADQNNVPNSSWSLIGTAAVSIFKGGGKGNTGLEMQLWGNKLIQVCNEKFFELMPSYPKGIWMDWLIHIRYSTTNTGLLEVYLRKQGEQAYTKLFGSAMPTEFIGYPGQTEANNWMTFRVGDYRPSTELSTSINYYANVKIATTMQEAEAPPLQSLPPAYVNILYSVSPSDSGVISIDGKPATTTGTVQVRSGPAFQVTASPANGHRFKEIIITGPTNRDVKAMNSFVYYANTDLEIVAYFEPITEPQPAAELTRSFAIIGGSLLLREIIKDVTR